MAETGSAFTCLACRVGFGSVDMQRAHYRTDWHRYNLKRKVASMHPVTAEDFRSRVLTQKSRAEQAHSEESFTATCEACGNKHFSSQASYNNHLNSKRHREAASGKASKSARPASKGTATAAWQGVVLPAELARAVHGKMPASDRPQEGEERDSEGTATADEELAAEGKAPTEVPVEDAEGGPEDVPVEEGSCLFCRYLGADLEDLLKHMTAQHSFFIPDLAYLADLRGLLSYLQRKVYHHHLCLKCNGAGRGFYTLEGVQSHMADKGHNMLDYSDRGQMELSDYYDFRSSYPDFQRGADDLEDGEWEDVSGDEAADESEDGVVVDAATPAAASLSRALALRLPPPAVQFREETLELVLPGNRVVGHRSMRHYYKQRFHAEDQRESVIVEKLMSQYRAIGYHSAVALLTPEARRDRDRYRRMAQNARMKLGVKHNQFQFHYREQVLQ